MSNERPLETSTGLRSTPVEVSHTGWQQNTHNNNNVANIKVIINGHRRNLPSQDYVLCNPINFNYILCSNYIYMLFQPF